MKFPGYEQKHTIPGLGVLSSDIQGLYASKELANALKTTRGPLDKLIEDVEAIPLRYKEEILDGEDLIQRYTEIDNDPKNENPALHNQAVHKLAIEAKRGNAAEIERLVDTHEMFQRTKGQKPLTPDELDDTPFEYLIPGLLPKPWTLLVHADGGTVPIVGVFNGCMYTCLLYTSPSPRD